MTRVRLSTGAARALVTALLLLPTLSCWRNFNVNWNPFLGKQQSAVWIEIVNQENRPATLLLHKVESGRRIRKSLGVVDANSLKRYTIPWKSGKLQVEIIIRGAGSCTSYPAPIEAGEPLTMLIDLDSWGWACRKRTTGGGAGN